MEKATEGNRGYLNNSRRRFLLYLWIGAQSILAALLIIPGIRYLLQPLYEKIQSQRIQLGDLRAIPEGEPTQVEYSVVQQAGYQVQEEQEFVYVLRQGKNVNVFSPICTHMGCNVAWNREASEFQCPCHGGKFNREGEVIAGPPPKPLRQFSTEIEEGSLWITPGEDQA
ncbi:MAG: ubiquinol-cytochrome c reductase iron-sulfur subunit [Candidatus Marinimicrobia bacterium]|nr:ubiquinol-cytochrome c reductase iron-sulfur subunit [Candidatus Neomarinimicrobiota bacterium]MCF7827655.1 ubiquinol-cytochrome c reductase iron-sulfur subunit [Candidatus Neomarinimicrobiota bacterium]MCF7881290.1 ubiquinol-cytochrome c reductase iron-sulfur subunit [Candidatus Neomarinimicrobiota bacterium]